MFNIGPAELIIIFLVARLVVGPKRPSVVRTPGASRSSRSSAPRSPPRASHGDSNARVPSRRRSS